MLNVTQNNIILPIQPGAEVAQEVAVGQCGGDMGSVAGLFSKMLTGVMDDQPILKGDMDLQALLEANPELEAQIPVDILKQFLSSGGEDPKALEAFLSEFAGEEIDLSENLAENLNQAINILQEQDIDPHEMIQAIDPAILQKNELDIKKSLKVGTEAIEFVDKKSSSGSGKENQQNIMQFFDQSKGQQQGQDQGKSQQFTDQKTSIIELAGQKLPEETKALLETIDKEMLKDERFIQQLQNMLGKSSMTSAEAPSLNSTSPVAPLPPAFASFTQASPDSPILARPLQVLTPVGQGEWTQQFNDEVLWLGSQQIKAAAIKVTPAELGPVEVNIKVVNDVATIQFNSHSGQVRELIEQAVPRLRDMMQDQGIQLADVDVRDNSEEQQMKQQMQSNVDKEDKEDHLAFLNEVNGEEGSTTEEVATEVVKKITKGLVDFFA
jgi:flagellar hook-length control protein FliK